VSTTKQRVVVLISGNGSNLQAIIERLALGDVPARIVAVISNRPQAYGLERARAAGIPTQVIDHQRFSQRAAFDHALAAELHALKPSVILLAGFMRILSDTLVEAFRGQLINIHPSLLPAYRGRNTHSRVLAAGDSIHGCSVHYVTPDLDAGPVIAQARLSASKHSSISSTPRCLAGSRLAASASTTIRSPLMGWPARSHPVSMRSGIDALAALGGLDHGRGRAANRGCARRSAG
jgi:phosphoribosylglycinamide formyltransferase-1